MTKKLPIRILALFLVLMTVSRLWGEQVQQSTKLPRDENNVYGQFDNGLKYIIRHNVTPPGKFTAYLHVASGAINETDPQNGLAHFIEHMAFRGSTNYPDGKLVPFLNQSGMLFGADTNAHTNMQETLFKLSFPDNKPETIETALTIFSDYANGITFDPAAIDHERGVILEEMRTRESASFRMQKIITPQLYAGTHLVKHDLIGDPEIIKTAPQSEFLDYWNNWYRPEKITLIVAGDIDPNHVIEVARSKIGSFKARTAGKADQKAGLKPFTASQALIATDSEQVTAEVRMMKILPRREIPQTYGEYREDVVESIANWIINHRIADEISAGGAAYRSAGIGGGSFYDEVYQISATAQGDAPNLEKMIKSLIFQIKRGIDHGVTTHEILLAKQNILSSSEWAVKAEQSTDSTAFVTGIARAVKNKEAIMSAQQELELNKQALSEITADEIHKSLVENFKKDNFAYIAYLPAPKEGEAPITKDQILAAAENAWAQNTEAMKESQMSSSILPADPIPGKIASKEFDKDLALTNIVFENGIVMHHKYSDYKKDQISINFTLPGGLIQETAENKGVSAAASQIFANPATHRIGSSQLRDMLIGKIVGVTGGIGSDAMGIRLQCNNADLATGLQVVNALITDGAIEDSTLTDWKQKALKGIEARKTNVQAQLGELLNDQIMGGDLRFAAMNEAQVNAQTRENIEKWFHQIADNAAIEVTVVGDIKAEDAEAAINKYLGSLPTRKGKFTDLDSLRTLKRGDGPYQKAIEFTSVTPKAQVTAGFISCNELDPERRPLSLAALTLTDRMVQRIRVTEQLVYGISCRNSPSKAIPGTGMFTASSTTDPANADKLAGEIIEMIQDFAKTGPTDEELQTAKKQIINQLSTSMKEPEWWLGQLSELTYKNRKLDDLKALPNVFSTFTASDVKEALSKYVKDDKSISLRAVPGAAK